MPMICCIPLIMEYFQVDKIVLVGIHIIGNCRLEARKGLSKEQQEAIRFVFAPSLFLILYIQHSKCCRSFSVFETHVTICRNGQMTSGPKGKLAQRAAET